MFTSCLIVVAFRKFKLAYLVFFRPLYPNSHPLKFGTCFFFPRCNWGPLKKKRSTFSVWDEFFCSFCRGPQFGPKFAGGCIFSRGFFWVFFSQFQPLHSPPVDHRKHSDGCKGWYFLYKHEDYGIWNMEYFLKMEYGIQSAMLGTTKYFKFPYINMGNIPAS